MGCYLKVHGDSEVCHNLKKRVKPPPRIKIHCSRGRFCARSGSKSEVEEEYGGVGSWD